MDLEDKNGVKDRILDDLGKSIKLIQRFALCGYEGVVVLGNDSWLVQSLCHLLDVVLCHGLRDLHRGYWPLVREFSHSDTLHIIQSLKTVTSSVGKGRAWLYHTLTEGSFQSYLNCLCRDIHILHRYYVANALLCDVPRMQQLLTLLAGIEQVQFNLNPDVPYLDMAAYQHPHSEVASDLLPSCGDPSNLGPRMTSSITSSLASPVDSGVALLDSDADTTSVSEATINETDSLRDDREDDSTYTEVEDNRINHQLLSLEATAFANQHLESTKTADLSNIKGQKKTDDPGGTKSNHQLLYQNTHPSIPFSHKLPDLPGGDLEPRKIFPKTTNDIGCDCNEDISAHRLSSVACGGPIETVDSIVPEEPAPVQIVESSECKAPCIADAFRSRSFSVMTASDIANQNVDEDIMVSSEVFETPIASPSVFVESKNKVNSTLNLKDSLEGSPKAGTVTVTASDTNDIVYRRQRNKKKRNNANGANNGCSTAADSTTKVKRVSFHEDLIIDSNKNSSEFSASFLPADSVIKRDAVKGRYSWCGEGDAPFMRKRNESDVKSDLYISNSISASSEETICSEEVVKNTNQVLNSVPYNQKSLASKDNVFSTSRTTTPPVAERGTPEGQEDPPNSASNLFINKTGCISTENRKGIGTVLSDALGGMGGSLKRFPSVSTSISWHSDSESIPASDTEIICSRTGHLISSSFRETFYLNSPLGSSLTDIRCSKPSSPLRVARKCSPLGLTRDVASKTSLLNRFMRSLTEKKFVQKKSKVVLKPSRSLYIRGVKKPTPEDAIEKFKSDMEAAMKMKTDIKVQNAAFDISSLESVFKTQVFKTSEEKLRQIFKVTTPYNSDGNGKPVFAILTDTTIYITGVNNNYNYYNWLVMAYTELDGILIGPNYQTILLVSTDRNKEFLLITGNKCNTENLVVQLEMAMRQAPTKPSLPSVRILELCDMKALTHSLAKDVTMIEGENMCHYSMVHLQDGNLSPPTTPMGPIKEGHLMFRTASKAPLQPWEPGFFILKAGVLYMFVEKSQRLPKRVIPLRSNGCKGCRRIPFAQRPHTFEILVGPRKSFQFAAADEYEASDWLQAFVQAACGVYEEERVETVACTLVVTEEHLVTCKEKLPTIMDECNSSRTLSCAAIQDMTAFISPIDDHSWCVLEFACREVHESSGDWVLYFSSPAEMSSFKQVLEQLWLTLQKSDFPLQLEVDESLSRRCTETSSLLVRAWDIMLPPGTEVHSLEVYQQMASVFSKFCLKIMEQKSTLRCFPCGHSNNVMN